MMPQEPLQDRDRRAVPRPVAWVVVLATSAALATALLFAAMIRNDYRATLDHGWLTSENAAGLLSDHVSRAFEISELVTEFSAEQVIRRGMEFFRTDAGWSELQRLVNSAPMLNSVWIFDAQGNLVASSTNREPPHANFADRKYYDAIKKGAGVHVMGLTYGRVSKVWFYSYNRAIRENGELIGIVQAAMQADSFGKVFDSLGLGRDARVSIYKSDGTVVMRWPIDPTDSGINEGESALFVDHLPNAPSGRFEDRIRGEPHLRAYRSLPEPDVIVTASAPRDAVFAPFWRRVESSSLFFGGVFLALVGFAAAAAHSASRERMELRARTRTEYALRESEQKFRGVFEHAATGIAITDLQGRFQSCNASYERLIGYPQQELRSLTFNELVHPEDRRENVIQTERLLAEEVPSFEIVNRYIGKSGSDVWVHKHLSLLRDGHGKAIGVIALVTDMTERKRAEKDLRESEIRFRATFDNAGVGIAHVGPDGTWLRVNDRMCDIVGYSREELLTKTFQDITHPDDLPRDAHDAARLAAGEIDTYRMEKRYVRKDGSAVWVDLTGACVRDANGALDYFIGVVEDIGERKAAETALHAKTQQLESLLTNAPIAVAFLDRGHRYIQVNEELAATNGAPPADHVGRTIEEMVPAKADILAPLIDRVFETGTNVGAIEIRSETPREPGVQRDWIAGFYPVHDERGAVDMVGFWETDVTNLKEAERAVREGADFMTNVLDNLTAFVGVLDLEGTLVQVNKAPLDRARIDASEVIGKKFWDCHWWAHSLEAQERLRAAFAVAVTGETIRYDVQVRMAGGESVWMDLQIAPLRDGNGRITHVVPSAIEISERKRAEEKLQRSFDTYLDLIENAPIGVFLVDSELRLTQTSAGARQVFGGGGIRSRAHLDNVLRGSWAETPAAALVALVRRVLESGEAHRSADFKAQRIDRDEVASFDLRFERVTLPDGTYGVVCYLYDLTERKRHEEHVEILMREVNHRSKNMLSLVQAVARHTASTDTGDFIARFGERIQAISASQDLLVKSGWRGVDLGDLVQSQLAHFEDILGGRIDYRGPTVTLTAAAAQTIGMALHELATNAGKYGALSNQDGYVEIRWAIEKQDGAEQYFVLSWIEKDGPPVTEPMRRGFGSTVTSRVAKMSLGADVTLQFRPDGLFWSLRCGAMRVLEGDFRALGSVSASEPERTEAHSSILVVDDEPLIALEVAEVLTKEGFDVVGPANSVSAALDLLDRTGCDAAVLDVALGSETSESIARKLKERGTPFVVFSGYARAQQPTCVQDAPLVPKPLRADQLVRELRNCLRGPAGPARNSAGSRSR